MSESNLWKRMKEGVQAHCIAQRIENMVGSGVPDVILHRKSDGCAAFVELKYRPEMPAKGSTPIFKGQYGLRRPDQVSWNYSRAELGAKVWILCQCGSQLFLIHGRFSRELDTFNAEQLQRQCSWMGSARRTDWGTMLAHVFDPTA